MARIEKDPVETARELVRGLVDVYGDRLRSALLHGSVARGEAVPGVSDINVFVLLEAIGAEDLQRGSQLARRWVEAGNTPPLYMAWPEWRRAADAFAIELADMRDAHLVLHGPDPLEGLEVDRIALRLQAEREIRGKLVQLREGLLLAAEEPEQVGRLLVGALPSFATYMRTALRLAGRPVARATADVIRETARLLGEDATPVLELWQARMAGKPPRLSVTDSRSVAYYRFAERVAEFIDHVSEAEAP